MMCDPEIAEDHPVDADDEAIREDRQVPGAFPGSGETALHQDRAEDELDVVLTRGRREGLSRERAVSPVVHFDLVGAPPLRLGKEKVSIALRPDAEERQTGERGRQWKLGLEPKYSGARRLVQQIQKGRHRYDVHILD